MLTTNEMAKLQVLMAKADLTQFDQMAEMFNTTRRMKNNAIKHTFSVGQNVKWTGRRGAMNGTIQRINKKNIVVNAGSAGMWNVSPSLLIAA